MLAQYIKDKIGFRYNNDEYGDYVIGELLFQVSLNSDMCDDIKDVFKMEAKTHIEDVIKMEMVNGFNHDIVTMIRETLEDLYKIKYTTSMYSNSVELIDKRISELNEKLRLYQGH